MSPEFLKQYYAVALPSFLLFQICLVLFYSYRQTSGFYSFSSEAQFPWLCQLPGPNNKRIEKGEKHTQNTRGFPLLESMTPLIRGEGLLTSELSGAYRLLSVGT